MVLFFASLFLPFLFCFLYSHSFSAASSEIQWNVFISIEDAPAKTERKKTINKMIVYDGFVSNVKRSPRIKVKRFKTTLNSLHKNEIKAFARDGKFFQ